jgi:hypothetical protein
MIRIVNEARFFFSRRETFIFTRIVELVEGHEASLSRWRLGRDDEETRSTEGKIMADAIDTLFKVRRELPALMETELGFAQLTSADRSAAV